MKKPVKIYILVAACALLAACAEGFQDTLASPPPGESITDSSYIGPEACATCHLDIYNSFMSTGHPYKLNKISGQAPSFPQNTSPGVSEVPSGYSWSDITYVIGGFGWKARYIDSNGYIITGDAVQYNFANSTLGTAAGFSAYSATTAAGTKQYDCGKCHTTGYDASGASQDGLSGVVGNWQMPGISCEACHGPGANHTTTASTSDIVKDTSAAQCGTCHYRNADHTIAASSGMTDHHEQYDELILGSTSSTGGHTQFTCIECHDPHKSALYDTANAIKNYSDNKGCAASGCHSSSTYTVDSSGSGTAHATNGVTCLDCHMPYIVKSAKSIDVTLTADGSTIKKGDIRSHIFKFNTSATASQFNDAGTVVNPYITVKYSCLYCHTDKTVAEKAAEAANYH